MLPLIIVLLIVALLFGLGFFIEALFWIAAILFVIWLVGLIVGRGRWYGW